MARYILIDRNTGYIFGDTADFAAGKQSDLTPSEAVHLLNEHIGAGDASEGYEVYRADINGSEAVPVVLNGQDQETIEAVQRDCEYLGFFAAANAQEYAARAAAAKRNSLACFQSASTLRFLGYLE